MICVWDSVDEVSKVNANPGLGTDFYFRVHRYLLTIDTYSATVELSALIYSIDHRREKPMPFCLLLCLPKTNTA